MSDRQEQVAFRQPILEFLKGQNEQSIVIGFAMVVEIMSMDGERGVAVVTSDASGNPLQWYTIQGMSIALTDLDEFDEPLRDE